MSSHDLLTFFAVLPVTFMAWTLFQRLGRGGEYAPVVQFDLTLLRRLLRHDVLHYEQRALVVRALRDVIAEYHVAVQWHERWLGDAVDTDAADARVRPENARDFLRATQRLRLVLADKRLERSGLTDRDNLGWYWMESARALDDLDEFVMQMSDDPNDKAHNEAYASMKMLWELQAGLADHMTELASVSSDPSPAVR